MATTIDESTDDLLNKQLADAGFNASASSDTKIRLIWQLYAGYDFTNRWGIELAYLDLGPANTSFSGTTADIESFLTTTTNIHPQTAQGMILSVNHYLPIDYERRIKIRLGVYNWTADYSLNAGTITRQVKENGTNESYGVGLEIGRCKKHTKLGHLKFEQHYVNKEAFSILAFGFAYCF